MERRRSRIAEWTHFRDIARTTHPSLQWLGVVSALAERRNERGRMESMTGGRTGDRRPDQVSVCCLSVFGLASVTTISQRNAA